MNGHGHSLTLVKGHSDFKVKCLTFGLYTQVSDSGFHGPLVSVFNGLFFALFYFSKKLLTTARPRYDFCIVVLFFPPLDFEDFLFCLFFPAASSRLWQHTCRHK